MVFFSEKFGLCLFSSRSAADEPDLFASTSEKKRPKSDETRVRGILARKAQNALTVCSPGSKDCEIDALRSHTVRISETEAKKGSKADDKTLTQKVTREKKKRGDDLAFHPAEKERKVLKSSSSTVRP